MLWLHKHDWQEVHRSFLIRSHFTPIIMGKPEPLGDDSPLTIITQYCGMCRKYRQQELNGHVREIEKENAK